MIAPHALDAFEAFTRPYKDARILLDSSRASPETLAGLPPNYELTWNHTTLRALRVDPASLTCKSAIRARARSG